MGADLCGFIMVGPLNLDGSKAATAKQQFKDMQKEAAAVLKGDPEAMAAFMAKHKQPDGPAARRISFSPNADDPDDIREAMHSLVAVNADKLVDEFVEMWDDGGFRDRMSRENPSDDKMKIVVVGDMSYGDGPEEDSAWGLTERVNEYGLLGVLGIL